MDHDPDRRARRLLHRTQVVNPRTLFLYGGIFAVVFAWSLLEGQA